MLHDILDCWFFVGFDAKMYKLIEVRMFFFCLKHHGLCKYELLAQEILHHLGVLASI
jgi:hypothetical protein